MSDDSQKKPSIDEMQEQIKKMLEDKFGSQILSFSMPGTQRPAPKAPKEEEQAEPIRDLSFDMNPVQVKEYLDRYVIGQEEAKMILSVAVCDHYNHVRAVLEDPDAARAEYVKQNVILLGPTGVGKTYLVRTLAQLIGVPFVKADITKFSETGYVGGDVDDLVRELVRMADGDVELAECGIVFLDEIDKIAATAGPVGRDVSGRGVQTGLLKLLEETEVATRSPFDMAAQMREMMTLSRGEKAEKSTISTKHILFVVSGAFTTVPDIVEKRLTSSQVGFNAPVREREEADNLLKQVTTRDFIEYGFEPEFIGRLPIRVALDELSEEDLFNILKHSEGSLIRQYRENFEAYGLKVSFHDEGLRAVATRAIREGTGARGLMTVLESALRPFKFHLPGGPVQRFAVTRELIERPDEVMKSLHADPDYGLRFFLEGQVREFETDFLKDTGIKISFSDEAVDRAIALARERGEQVGPFLESTLMDYVYGLRIIQEHTTTDVFTLGPENLERPREVLDAWVKEALKKA